MTDDRQPGGLTCDQVRDDAASFVLGALPEREMEAVREHLASCPEPHPEMVELGGVLPVFDAAVAPIEPPVGLKDRIMAAAAADLEARQGAAAVPAAARGDAPAAVRTTAPAPSASTAVDGPLSESVSVPATRRPRWSWALGIAAVLVIVLLGGWNLSLMSRLDAAETYQRQVASVLDAAREPGALTAVMTTPSGEGPTGLAAVTADGEMRIAMRDLEPTTGDEVYEAWVILPDTAPDALGGFRVGPDGTGYLQAGGLPAQPGIVLALTREPRPGMTEPSGDPVSVGTATPISTG